MKTQHQKPTKSSSTVAQRGFLDRSRIVGSITTVSKIRLLLAVTTVVLVLSSTLSVVEGRKDRNQPHPHGGVLKPYQPGPFSDVKLSRQEETKLLNGQPVMKQTKPTKDAVGGSAICVQDVLAPKQAVWNQILELDSYKGKVPKVNSCSNYVVRKDRDGTCNIKTRMVIGVMPGYSYESYYDHTFHPKKDSVTWSLDYEKTSDFDDVAGHWHLEEIANEAPGDDDGCPVRTRVFYACDIKLRGAVPGPILNYISKAALKQATGWVKKESEKNPTGTISEKFLPKPAFAGSRQ